MEYLRRLDHLGHEGRLAAADAVVETYARKDAITEADACLRRGHEAARLRHQHDERGLSEIGGLAGHVRPCDERDLRRFAAAQREVVGDERLVRCDALDHGMATRAYA